MGAPGHNPIRRRLENCHDLAFGKALALLGERNPHPFGWDSPSDERDTASFVDT